MKYSYILLMLSLLFSCRENKDEKPKSSVTNVDTSAAIGPKMWSMQSLEAIDTASYNRQHHISGEKIYVYRSITDSLLANQMLKGIVRFGTYRDDRLVPCSSGTVVMDIKPKYARPIKGNINGKDLLFKAYYPGLDILVCTVEGSEEDLCYNLLTGASGEEAGNPYAIFPSEDGAVRINGYMASNDCTRYFIEKWEDGRYKTVLRNFFTYGDNENFPCNIRDAFWKDHYTLYMCTQNDGNTKYFVLKFIK